MLLLELRHLCMLIIASFRYLCMFAISLFSDSQTICLLLRLTRLMTTREQDDVPRSRPWKIGSDGGTGWPM